MPERSNGHAWKACKGDKPFASSNLAPSEKCGLKISLLRFGQDAFLFVLSSFFEQANMLSPVDEIKSRLDLIDVIQEYIQLKPGGANFKAACPFHQEKTPSFMVSRAKQIWHCFGCGAGGDMFTFIQQIEGVEFAEALRILAKKANVTLQRQNSVKQNLKTRLQDCIREAARFFHAQLMQSPRAESVRKYLSDVRRLNKDTIKEWKLGWAPDSWDETSRYLIKKGFTEKEIKDAGMVVEKQEERSRRYDRFRNRLMFPILDHNGNFVGFTARTLDKAESSGAKYINTPQTMIYDKSRVIYGMDKAKQYIRQENIAVIVEGNMDVIASHQEDVRNVIASSGTALTREQIMILKRYTDTLALAFDIDAAGQTAAERGIDIAWQEGMNVKVVAFSEEGIKDPDDLIKKDPSAWKHAIQNAQNIMDYYFARTLENIDISQVDQKRNAAKKLLPIISRLADPIEKDHYLHLLADRISVSESALRDALQKAQHRKERPMKHNSEEMTPKPVKSEQLSERLLALAIGDQKIYEKMTISFDKLWLEKRWQVLYIFLVDYYNTVTKFNWDEFMRMVEKEVPEQKALWLQISLLSDEIKEQLASESERHTDWLQVSRQLQNEFKKKKREKLSRDIEIIERKLEKTEDKEKRNILFKQLQELVNEVSLFTGS